MLGYAFNAIGNQNPELEWLYGLSPYYWAYGQSPLVGGVDVPTALLLAGVGLACAGFAVLALNRRDSHEA